MIINFSFDGKEWFHILDGSQLDVERLREICAFVEMASVQA